VGSESQGSSSAEIAGLPKGKHLLQARFFVLYGIPSGKGRPAWFQRVPQGKSRANAAISRSKPLPAPALSDRDASHGWRRNSSGVLARSSMWKRGARQLASWRAMLVRLAGSSKCFLATRIASFDKQAITDIKRLVNVTCLPPDIEMESGWNACVASMARPATQQRIKTLIERGFSKPGDAENRLGVFVGRR
jgi:hypothetical protein